MLQKRESINNAKYTELDIFTEYPIQLQLRWELALSTLPKPGSIPFADD